jgi:hypothetical protein
VATVSSPATYAPSPTSPAVGPDLIGRLGCGQGSEIDVPVNVLHQPAEGELAPTAQAEALRTFVMTPDAAEVGYPRSGWRVVSISPTRVDYLAPGRDGWYFVSVEGIPDLGGWLAWEHGRRGSRAVRRQFVPRAASPLTVPDGSQRIGQRDWRARQDLRARMA